MFLMLHFFRAVLPVFVFSSGFLIFSLSSLCAAPVFEGVRLAPRDVEIVSSATLPAQAAAQEAAALVHAFDRSTASALALFADATITVSVDAGSSVSALRVHGASPYALSLSVGTAQGNNIDWSSVASVQGLDLSVLPSGWSTLDLGGSVPADVLELSFTLLEGGAAAAQIRRFPASGGTRNISSNNPTETIVFDNAYQPADIARAWLSYEFKGVHDWMAVRRSLNGGVAAGGGVLRDGDAGSALDSVADGAGDHVFELPLRRRASVGRVDLTFSAAVSGQIDIDALQEDGGGVSAGVSGASLASDALITVSGTTYSITMDGMSAAALRVTLSGTGGPVALAEAAVSGSPVGAARTPASLVLTWPRAGSYYGRTGIIRGFVLPGESVSGPAEIHVAGLPFEAPGGAFEVAITKDQAGFMADADDAPWSVEVVALYPDGSSVVRVVDFDAPSYAEGLSAYTPEGLAEVFAAGEEKTVAHEQAELTVPAGALAQDTEIRISALRDIEVAKLDTGLINVTRGPRRGYRMLPHMHFNAKVKVKPPFDKARVPQGYTEADVSLFYFDVAAGRWMLLEGGVADAAGETVEAETTHFTDFIAGVVVAPESPQVARHDPTSFKDMKAADPSAKINLIAPPQGSSSGDAALSYPLELPPGRQGMAPQLSLQYASAGGNGWMGLGWSLPMQAVTIDTRWGAPRYSATQETETYLWNGRQLTPVAHRGALVPRAAERVFQARVEGSFARIVRHGADPADYWWEVTDKMGTRYAYGGDLDTGAQVAEAVLTDDAGNVFTWALTEMRDTNGNRVAHSYVSVSDTGLALGGVPGRQLYRAAIRYTGDGAGPGPFEVRFVRDRELPGFTRRRDTIIDGRGGFKMVTADLLRRVEIIYAGALVRAYGFEYEEGAFHKQLLRRVTQFDAANQAFNTHAFEYFDDARENGAYRGFATAVDWSSPDDGVGLGDIVEREARALSGHAGTRTGWHLYTGIALGAPEKRQSLGVKIGGNSGGSDGRLLLIDLNGDGLSDKVFVTAGGIFMRANESGPGGAARFSETPVQVADLPALMRETSTMSSRGIESFIGIAAGINWADAVTVSDIYFTDANGDGLPDLNLNGQLLFNVLDPAGTPGFTPDSSLSASPIGPAAVDAAAVQIAFDDLYQQLIDDAPLMDAVRSWRAPYTGQVQITGDVALIEDLSPARAAYQTADGVRVAIQHNGAELYALEIADTDYTPKTPGLNPVEVVAGDVIYFRVQSGVDGAYDQVSWAPVIEYTDLAPALDANGLAATVFDAAADFVPFADKAPGFSAPFDGAVRVSATLNKTAQTSDDVRLELLMNGVAVAAQSLAWDQTGPLPILFDTPVQRSVVDAAGGVIQAADVLELRLVTESQIDLAALAWSALDPPRIWYTASADPDLADLLDENGDPATMRPFPPRTRLFSHNDLTAPLAPWLADEDGLVTVDPGVVIAPGNGGLDTEIVVTVKSGGGLVAKASIPVVNGVPAPAPFEFTAVLGEAYFFEFTSATPDILSAISTRDIALSLPSGLVIDAPTAFRGAERATVLSQPYRGWRVFGYDGNRERATQPISITASDLTGPTAAEAAALEQAISDAIANGQPDDALVLASQRSLVPFFPAPSDAVPSETRWRSGDANLWSEAAVQSASRYGIDVVSVPDIMAFAGAQAVPRVSTTSQFGAGAGVSFVNGAVSTSQTVSVLDFLDLNGDRFPDVVSGGQLVQFSPMTGGLEAAALTMAGAPPDIRATDGAAQSFGIGGSFPHQSAKAKGRVDVTATGGSLWVRFNLGYRFGAEELYGTAEINDGASETVSLGLSIGFNDGVYGFAGGLNGSRSAARAFASLADVNGDGLVDAVGQGAAANTLAVRLNSGSTFEPPIVWSTGGQGTLPTESASVSAGLGAYFTIAVPLSPAPPVSLILNPGADTGRAMSRLESSIQDLDGDGFPGFLRSEDDDDLSVSFDTIGRTNLLRAVHRPLGSTVTLAYARSGNTGDQPQNKWVLARVEVFDGVAGDGTDILATAFAYETGRWDRAEREFYGYARVIEDHLNVDAPGGEAVYRTVTRDFLNGTYYQKGLLAASTTADASGALFLETVNTYRFVDVATGTDVGDPESLTATVFPQLVRTDSHFYEGQAVAGKSTFVTYAYDQYGNVVEYVDAANLETTDDDVTSTIGYHQDLAAHIVGKADAVVVTGNGAVHRERQADFAPGTGNMTQLRGLLADGGIAVTDLAYDGFGNLTGVTGPANASGQRYARDYDYDPAVATYVTRVEDSFGYVSTASYDERFGAMLSRVDPNDQPTTYTLDDAGRVIAVQGPYQAGTGLDTITFAYNPRRDVPGDAQYPDVDVSWALTRHIDVHRDGADPIETALFVDGLGRALQTKKDAAIHDGAQSVDRMVASGRIGFDFLGRRTEQYYPVEEPLGQAGVFNPAYDAVPPTITDYDVLDRPVQVTIPDASTTSMLYDFGPDRAGQFRFRKRFTDAEGNQRETYADMRGLVTSVKEINPAGGQPVIWTSYAYDPLRQIVSVTDDQNNVTTTEYDNFGRMTALDSPDMGRTEYRFDLASNLVAKETANLRAAGLEIVYDYDFTRPASIGYPQFPENDVSYTYGAPGAAHNRAGRIVTATSQGGIEERFYGPLGEMVQQVRTVNSDTQGNAPQSPEVYTTTWTYDTWNRLHAMTYPDGEVLTNQYDSGGRLRRIDGAKTGVDYEYLRHLGYDKFGQRVYLHAGNGTETAYAYVPTTRRLDGLVAGNAQGRTFQDLSYTYDPVGNITAQANAASVTGASQMGGATAFTYEYDDLYRLTGATGLWEYQPGKSEEFTLAMSYDTIHNIVSKDQLHARVQPSGTRVEQHKTSYDWSYTYAAPQPHAPSLIGDRAYTYDLNGNQTGWQHVSNGTGRTIVWDEESRIQEISDNGHAKRYKYDDAGERELKRGPQGETAYVNPFFSMRNREVGTKHVFAGGTRLVSKLVRQPKDVDGDGVADPLPGCANPPWGWTQGQGGGQGQGNAGGNGQGQGPCGNNGQGGPEVQERDLYFYHPDHLGASSYVTDADGEIFQHLEYFPFGETFVEEHANTQRTPYLFTSKELDEDTALYYFGARYYDPR
ncbi:MAG: SpvB/TcaC N-terminal domain-containing protein, partial [Pseudomonadota bacterium]